MASAAEVDQYGVAAATRMAMGRAVNALSVKPAHLFIDWMRLPDLKTAQTNWAKADEHSVSVAAASILAKVHRDRLLAEIGVSYPVFGFQRHKGYGTPDHLAALSEHGPCPEHRLSFAPVARWRSLFDLSNYESRRKSENETGEFS
jgi:ribonuclease HII